MHVRISLALILTFLLFSPAAVPAQDDAPAAAPSGPAAAAFDKLSTEWKELLAQMGVLQAEYRDADQKKRDEIKQKWTKLVEKGTAMEAQLIAAAEKAYAEAPNADKKVTDMLVDVLIGHVQSRPYQPQTDNYDEALRIAKLLIDKKCPDKRIYSAAGIAAFAVGNFDEAEKYLKQAGEKDISELGSMHLQNIPKYKELWAKEQAIRKAEAEADDLPRVKFKTSKGDVEIELFENEAPGAVANFVSLVEKGYYNGLVFHRVLPGFMAQGGCPEGTGTGGPGYNIACECHQPNHRKHFRGSLSMAHAGRDTGGSQFFLTFLPTSHLDGRHTVFGRVIKGFEVLHQLQRRDPSRPNQPPADKITEATVIRKRDHEYKPKKVGD